jgi:hypothetical protein
MATWRTDTGKILKLRFPIWTTSSRPFQIQSSGTGEASGCADALRSQIDHLMRNMVQGLTRRERPMAPQRLHVAQHDFAAVSTIQASAVSTDVAVARLDQLDQIPFSATA